MIAFTMWESDPDRRSGITCIESSGAVVRDNIFWINGPAEIDTTCAELPGLVGNVIPDPRFCATSTQLGQGLAGDWRAMPGSPVAPGGPYEAWGARLGVCDGTQILQSTWGRVKAIYR